VCVSRVIVIRSTPISIITKQLVRAGIAVSSPEPLSSRFPVQPEFSRRPSVTPGRYRTPRLDVMRAAAEAPGFLTP